LEDIQPLPFSKGKKNRETYMLKNTVVGLHSPRHSQINGIPDDLQSFNRDVIWYYPGVGLCPNPSLVCGDENPMKHVVVLSSKRKGRKFPAILPV
jgi:hypothetical protein